MPSLRAHVERWAVAAATVLSLILFGLGAGACQPGGEGDPSATVGDPAGNALLERVEWGRLADVYGLDDGRVVLFRADVLVGSDIRDERPVGASLLDEQITYDVLSVDPDSLQERILITRELGSAEFATAFAALDERVVSVAPGVVGQDTNVAPFSVVPRNAALRLTFSRSLQVDDATCFGIYYSELNDAYISHGELSITRFDLNGSIIWKSTGADIFCEGFALHDTFVEATDFDDNDYRFDYSTGKLQ